MKKIEQLSDWDYQSLLQPIFDFTVIQDIPSRADAIFVFGSVRLKSVWKQALELFKGGYSKIVLVTGNVGSIETHGYTQNKIIPEAEQISRFLIENAVPDNAIIKEPNATNTLENVLFGMAALQAAGAHPKKLILVGKPGHMLRCWATFKKQFPDIELLCCPPAGTVLDSIDRPRKEFAARAIGEIDRLEKYSEKGDIVKIPVPQELRKSITKIESYLC